MTTKTKQRLSREVEEARASHIDTALTYLECSDFAPPVKQFLPMFGWMLKPLHGQILAALRETLSQPVVPMGLLYGQSHRLRPCQFEFHACQPVDRERIERLASMMPRAMLNLPRTAQYCQLTSSRVLRDGTVASSLPRYYFAYSSGEIRCWNPVVRPAPIGTRWTTGGSGESGSYAEYAIERGDMAGATPRIVSSIPIVRRKVWSVAVSAENGRSELLLLTSEEGACGFFNLRNSPLTASGRRSALQHWVKAHSRRKADGEKTDISRHLRGVESFCWFGLNCRISAPTDA